MKKYVLMIFLAVGAFALKADNAKLSNMTKLLLLNSKENQVKSKGVKSMVKEDNTIAAYVTVNEKYEKGLVEKLGGRVRNHYESIGIMTVDIPVNAIEILSADEGVVAIEIAKPVKIQMKEARDASNASLNIMGLAPLTHSYMADGVLLGIVDQEIQVNHINFYSRNRNRLRIKRFLNQLNGREYTDSAAIAAAKYDTREMSSGHATHVLGIAAGADQTTDYYGIAQFADLAVVATTGDDADISDGVKYIFDYADEVNKPCVVNISMGGLLGSHDGTEICNRVIESLVGPGRLVVAAAGNSGDMAMHVGKTLNGEDSLKTFMRLMYDFWYNYTMTDIWGDSAQNYEVSFVVYNERKDSIVFATPFYSATKDTAFTLHVDTLLGSYNTIDFTVELATGVSDYNSRGNLYFEYTMDDMPSNCYFGIIARGDSGTVNMWTYDELSYFSDNGMSDEGWSNGDSEMTIGTGIGDTKNVITVGSYCTTASSGWSDYGSVKEDISTFSSKGPMSNGQLKPEITAPGEVIISSIPDVNDLSYYRTANTKVDGKTYYYGEMQGTSMSSPYCAGVIASWLEAKPDLTYEEVLDVFRHSSRLDRYTGTANIPNNTWGYGKLNAYSGLIYLLGLNADLNEAAEQKLVGYVRDNVAHIAGLVGDVDIRIVDMSGKTVYSNTYGDMTMGDEIEIDMSNMADGVYVISVNGDNLKVIK